MHPVGDWSGFREYWSIEAACVLLIFKSHDHEVLVGFRPADDHAGARAREIWQDVLVFGGPPQKVRAQGGDLKRDVRYVPLSQR
jgi:hypothetical protein